MAHEFAKYGIRVNCIAPGGIASPMAAHAPASFRERLANVTPLRRWGQPEEVASVALFLASDDSSYMSGAVLVVDGGRIGITPATGEPYGA